MSRLLFVCVFVLCVVCVNSIEPITLTVGGVAAAGGLWYVMGVNTHYNGDVDVCVTSHGDYQANPFIGFTTCMKPAYSVHLAKKQSCGIKDIDVTTNDGRRAKLSLDAVLKSDSLEEMATVLVDMYYTPDRAFRDSVITIPIEHCIQNYVNTLTHDQLLVPQGRDENFRKAIDICMDIYNTGFRTTRNTYVSIKRMS